VLALPFTIAENANVCLGVSAPRLGAIVTVTLAAGVIVTVAVPDFVLSATDFAVRETVAGEGTTAGAVYVIATPEALVLAESVPQVAPEHPVPLSVHVTPLFARRS